LREFLAESYDIAGELERPFSRVAQRQRRHDESPIKFRAAMVGLYLLLDDP
jgi:hypothetical protein